MATPWIALLSTGSWLLLLQLGQPGRPAGESGIQAEPRETNSAQLLPDDQEQSGEQEQSGTTVQNDPQEDPITANAGKFVLKVTRTDAIDQMKLQAKPSSNRAVNMLLDQLQNESQNPRNNSQGNQQFPGELMEAAGRMGGASGGFASGSSSSSGSVTSGSNGGFVRPNIAVALKVDSHDKGIFELENMQAVDDRGQPVLWMGPDSFHFYDPAFEKGLDGEIIAYFQEENDTGYLTVSGDLKVTPGRRIEVEFPNGKPSTKKSGEHSFVLKNVETNDRGVHVTMSLPQIAKPRGNRAGNAQAMMKALLEQHGAIEVLIRDSDGVLHSPSASGSSGGNSNAGGGGGGISSASGFSSTDGNGDESSNSSESFEQDNASGSTQSFTFGRLPDGLEINSVVVRAIEKTGKPQSHPFKFYKIPVPYGTR